MMSNKTKKVLFWFFLPFDIIFAIVTIPALFIFLPVGIIGLAATTLYTLVLISIRQSLAGKKPILNLFREGAKTCKKCGHTYTRKLLYCPECAKRKKKELPTYPEMREAAVARKQRKAAFWNAVGTLMVVDELTEPKPKKKDVWTRMETEGEWIDHNSEGHDLEDGYCIDCDSNIEDMF